MNLCALGNAALPSAAYISLPGQPPRKRGSAGPLTRAASPHWLERNHDADLCLVRPSPRRSNCSLQSSVPSFFFHFSSLQTHDTTRLRSDIYTAPPIAVPVVAAPMKRAVLFIAILLVLLLAGAFLYFRNKQYEVVITQRQIDDALQEKFPVTKTHLLIFRLTYSNPHLTLLPESNRIEVGLDAKVNIKLLNESKELGGTAIVTAGLAYRNETKQFFLSNPEINKLTIQVPSNTIDR